MPGQPCATHPQEATLVRCARCDRPICVRCMVDTPVGKKCRDCARNRTHLSESTPQQVARGFAGALALAVPVAAVLHELQILVGAFVYGWVVGEAALRAGGRSRSLAMQAAAGVAALLGSVVGAALLRLVTTGGLPGPEALLPDGYALLLTVLGVGAAVVSVRYL